MSNVIVLGGDGFCGWPTSLYLSMKGHNVLIVDNLSRRNIDNELGAQSLTPVASIHDRLSAWERLTGKVIKFEYLNIVNNFEKLKSVIENFEADTIVHFAEQRAAPYSMKSAVHKNYTVDNNISATHNVLSAVTEVNKNIHIVHLGTMGVYGYGTAGMKIPEGYLQVKTVTDSGEEQKQEILYPVNPGSVYHMTKTLDQLMFAYYNKNDNISITDLHQGIVWGTQTTETKMDEKLINRFDYDGDYGTVLNRFLMQSVVGHPLTVHGTGGQTRAFIHISDTVRCIEIAIKNRPKVGERVKIYNQMTETHTVKNLANMIAELTESDIDFVSNPRKEAAENDLHVENKQFLTEGLSPIMLQDGLIDEVLEIAKKYKSRCDLSLIPCRSFWTQDQKNDAK